MPFSEVILFHLVKFQQMIVENRFFDYTKSKVN